MISFKNAERCHKRMWNWLAKTGSKTKFAWPEFYILNPKNGRVIQFPDNDCFACELNQDNCRFCPIDWNGKGEDCYSPNSPYLKWENAKTIKTRKKYAAIIRDMLWERKRGKKICQK